MDHHTAVHIVGGAARRLLGPHIFQAGSHLSVDSGRLDITHYHRLTRDDLDAMEDMANAVLAEVRTTEKTELNRKDADMVHGFDLYRAGTEGRFDPNFENCRPRHSGLRRNASR